MHSRFVYKKWLTIVKSFFYFIFSHILSFFRCYNHHPEAIFIVHILLQYFPIRFRSTILPKKQQQSKPILSR